MKTMTMEEAKDIIDRMSARDMSKACESEKRAKVLNKILSCYTIVSNNSSYNNVSGYSLDEIGHLLGVSKQYIGRTESIAVEKIQNFLCENEESTNDILNILSTEGEY